MVRTSFVEIQSDSHFPIQNLPYGLFKPEPDSEPRHGVAVGKYVLDLSVIASAGLFDGPVLKNSDCFNKLNLNKFVGLGRPAWKEARATLQKLLSATEPTLRDNPSLRQKVLVPMVKVQMLLPVMIGDYTDFSASMHHAKNCGPLPEILRWFHIMISATSVSPEDKATQLEILHPILDLLAAVVGPGNELGKPVDVNEAADHILGLVFMNDWSARDIQAWEYVPLGPFLGKIFDALEPFVSDSPKKNPPPFPYLAEKISKNYYISLQVSVKPAGEENTCIVTRSNFKHLYWTITQQLAHHTINCCNLRPGDLLGTGAISGPEPESYGCLLARVNLEWTKTFTFRWINSVHFWKMETKLLLLAVARGMVTLLAWNLLGKDSPIAILKTHCCWFG
ncbi:unnamed protein product [Fraxinus pennsylvanica]|uniref:Fumarylacetoacetase n=1 Tax=Fraxinus pennsylvanica TaxID=56036 RepID=A0AAD2DKW4_9LAMI|nr:unnamed protein product [Fraxinus pennsylvanica]